MAELTFDDYKNRISIQEVLQDAGYHFYRRDGLRWPCYYRLDNEGRRIHGDKFIVCGNGKACFQPPQMRKYNVISFISEHPHFFPEGHAGKDPYAVVNQVCRRLLNEPVEERRQRIYEPRKAANPFVLSDYEFEIWKRNDWDSQKKFFPFFAPRAITRQTQRAFADQFCLTTLKDRAGARQNLSFAMRILGEDNVVGLEQRGMPDENGKNSYKGMARGTNATEGVWMASPKLGRTTSSNLDKVSDVYWFESALDAMSFYQLRTEPLKEQIESLKERAKTVPIAKEGLTMVREELNRYNSALYVSTGGSPSISQFSGVLKNTPFADHHVCFDNDKAGHVFAIDLLLTRAGRDFQTAILDNGRLQVIDQSEEKGKKFTLNLEPFEFDRIAHVLGVGNPNMKDYIQSMKNMDDPKSGDYDLLPPSSLALFFYDKIYALEEQWCSGELLWGIPKEQEQEVTDRYKMVMSDLWKGFNETLKTDVETYMKKKSSIDIEIPPMGCKDWNEVIMDKRQYDEQDTISTIGENGEVITDEVNQDHEETVKRHDDDEEETTKRYSRR